jgi:NAD kinase
MNLNNVLITTRETELEMYRREYDNIKDVLTEQDLDAITSRHAKHYESLDIVRKHLTERKIPFQIIYMPNAAYDEFKGRDMILSLGGDGTVLNTARYILNSAPLLAIRSDSTSVGALCTINAVRFEETLDKIIGEEYTVQHWTRIEGKLGNRKDIALNEIVIGSKYLVDTAKYEITFRGKSERQYSSGLIVCTGSGSSAWYKNILRTGESFPKEKEELYFTSMFDFIDYKYELAKGNVHKDEVLYVRSNMNVDGKISFDCGKEKRMWDFKRGQVVEIRISDKPLKVIIPNLSQLPL